MRNDQFYRDSWVEINLDHVEYNIKQLAAHIGEDKGIYAVVKANAYGHGYVQVAQTALDAGAQALAVAFWMRQSICAKMAFMQPSLCLGRLGRRMRQ